MPSIQDLEELFLPHSIQEGHKSGYTSNKKYYKYLENGYNIHKKIFKAGF